MEILLLERKRSFNGETFTIVQKVKYMKVHINPWYKIDYIGLSMSKQGTQNQSRYLHAYLNIVHA